MPESNSRAGGLAHSWNGRVTSWDRQLHDTSAFGIIRRAVFDAATPQPADVAVDLGAGTGFLTFPLAALTSKVTAVDISPAMCASLIAGACRPGLGTITAVTADLTGYDQPPASADLVVSSYALHHLTDRDKALLLRRIHSWLRPGGRLVIADMMFGRGGDPRDRAILRTKIAALARKGPGGWWRIVKNVSRIGLRMGSERPASPAFWQRQAAAAGFAQVCYRPLIAEAGLLIAEVSPAPPPALQAARREAMRHQS